MKIIKAEFHKLVAFQYFEIEKLHLTFTDPLQIIIGTNGSGKSNLLRQLTPLPPTRSEYMENGYKKITLEYQNSTYVLISDFSNKTSPHQFIRDDEPLNEGGTTNVQIELIKTYLNWDTDIETILRGNHNFASLSPSLRKTLLIESNPSQIGFILEEHKKVLSQIRACKNNLSMLEERKAILDAKFIDGSVLENLIQERNQLISDSEMNLGFMSTLRNEIKHLEQSHSNKKEVIDFDEIKKLRHYIVTHYQYWETINKQNPMETIHYLSSSLDLLLKQKEGYTQELTKLTNTINDYQNTIQEMSDEERVTVIRLNIKGYTQEKKSIENNITDDPISKKEVAEKDFILSEVRSVLTSFIGNDQEILHSRIYQLKQNKVSRAFHRLQSFRRQIQQLENRQDHLRRSQKIRLKDIPTENCAKMDCPLYVTFRLNYDEVVREYNDNETNLISLRHHEKRYQRYCEEQQNRLELQNPLQANLSRLHGLMMNHACVRQVFIDKPVLRLLKINPMIFYHSLENLVTQSENVYRLKEIDDLLQKETLLLNKYIQSSEQEKLKLEIILENLKKQHNQMTKTLIENDQIIINTQLDLSRKKQYFHSIQKLSEIKSSIETSLKDKGIEFQIDYLKSVLSKIEDLQKQFLMRSGEISVIIRDQETLKSRYQEEIINQIEKIEKDKKEWEALEFCLSKIPQKYTIVFINNIIILMNFYISSVFTYPFRLILLDEEKPLDYKFSVQVGNYIVSDISLCSSAQIEIINFVFSFALRKLRHLSDYPIYIDEIGKSFDITHKNRLLNLLRYIIDHNDVSQMFLVNHDNIIHDGLLNNETLVLSDLNVVLPEIYNKHAIFNG